MSSSPDESSSEEGDDTLPIKAAPKLVCREVLGRLDRFWVIHDGRRNDDVPKFSSGIVSRVIELKFHHNINHTTPDKHNSSVCEGGSKR